MAVRKAQRKNQPVRSTRSVKSTEQSTSSNWLDYIRFGESYTSLILGIIVVIITTILLVFTVKDRSVLPDDMTPNTTKQVSSTKIEPTVETTIGQLIATGTPIPTVPPATSTPQPTAKPTVRPTTQPTRPVATATVKVQPTTRPTTRPTTQPTAQPTTRPTAKPTVQPTAIAQKPTNVPQPTAAQTAGGQKTYTVAAGDTLWSIAEKHYKSGYNWVDIASANKLSNPGVITAGTKLTIPNVAPKTATVQDTNTTAFGPKITGSTYTVQKGDHLWGIAVRAYGDGFKWTEIAKLNNITAPSLIYSGVVLKLPRTTSPPAK